MTRLARAAALSQVLEHPDWWREKARGASPLEWPQCMARDVIMQAILDNQTTRAGGVWVVMSARQTMKNETESEVEAQVLYAFSRYGGCYVRTAPSWDQIITSRQRLMDVTTSCPVCTAYGRARQIEGGFTVVPWGRAKIRFVSSDPTARVTGATASIALSNDEFQDVDADHYQLAIEPFTSSTNAPIICWGVAAEGEDPLHYERMRNEVDHPERNLIYPADVWAEIWPATYGKTWADKLAKYGRDNPAIRMNYLLQPVSAVASFLGTYMESLLAGNHNRTPAPPSGMGIVMVVDVAGEEDLGSEEVVEAVRAGKSDLDSTAVIIAAVDRTGLSHELARISILDERVWVGMAWEEQQRNLEKLIALWQPVSLVIDACGIGQMLARGLRKQFGGRVLAYTADAASIDEDITELYAYLYNGLIKMHSNDSSVDYEDAVRQLKAARRIVKSGKLKVGKDKTTDRIDFAKALTYLPRAAKRMGGAAATTGGEKKRYGGSEHGKGQPKARELTKRW